MRISRGLWLGLPLLMATVLACADGRGSSGFDVRGEEQVIGQVLSTGGCEDHGRLVICAADPTTTPSPTPTGLGASTPLPTPTQASTPLPTPTPSAPGIWTDLYGAVAFPCDSDGNSCTAKFTFKPQGFSEGTTFLVAARGVAPNTFWSTAPPPAADGLGNLTTTVRVTIGSPPGRVQLAVLAFNQPTNTVPTEFEQLAETGASYAFVTQALLIEAEQPPPTAAPPAENGSGSVLGPSITYLGLAGADGSPMQPSDLDDEGRDVFSPYFGSGFYLVIEAAPGQSGSPVGLHAVDFSGGAPDLQLLVSQPLGDGNPLVCDLAPPSIGGVPGTTPPVFSNDPAVVAAMNDLGCRADDGTGNPLGRGPADACTQLPSGEFRFASADSSTQFCMPIAQKWAFPPGRTTVVARARDVSGHLGFAKQIVIALAPTPNLGTATPTSARPTTTRTPPAVPTPMSLGPVITYFGLARADDTPETPTSVDALGRDVFSLTSGSGFSLVIEAAPGQSGSAVGSHAVDRSGGFPDLQLLVSQPLGNGDPQVCDTRFPNLGGVPATDPPVYSTTPDVLAAINDLGCRVDDGGGNPLGRGPSAACTLTANGEYGFVISASTAQFCLPIVRKWAFPLGETVVVARARDEDGNTGFEREIVISVSAPSPTVPATPTVVTPPPTPTPAAPGPSITYLGLAAADGRIQTPTGVDDAGRSVFSPRFGSGFYVVVEAAPGRSGSPVGLDAVDPNGGAPDLQLLVSRSLGNGNPAVCDTTPPNIGGVPGTDPPLYSDAPNVLAAMNDLGCRVDDGTGKPLGRGRIDACTQIPSGEFSFVQPASSTQFCLQVAAKWAFPPGQTVVAARARDTSGNVGLTEEIVVEVSSTTPTTTPTGRSDGSPTPSPNTGSGTPPSISPTVTSTSRLDTTPTPGPNGGSGATPTLQPTSTPTPSYTPTPSAFGPV